MKNPIKNDIKTYSSIINSYDLSTDNKLDKSSIVNDLSTGGVNKALSAEQAKILNELLEEIIASWE